MPAAADSPPGTAPSRSPTTRIAPGWLSASATVACSASTLASSPGTTRASLAPSFSRPRVANGAIAYTVSFFFRYALRSRRKRIGHSSSGSRPTSTTAGAFSTSA